jgi:hypothetical protein
VQREAVFYGLTSKQPVDLSQKGHNVQLSLSDNDLGLWIRDSWSWNMNASTAAGVSLLDRLELGVCYVFRLFLSELQR